MSRGVTRPLVGTRTWIKQAERDARDREFSDSMENLMYALAGRAATEADEPKP